MHGSIRAVLMVGIGGGNPNLAKCRDIRLGDIAVSKPTRTATGMIGGVLQYDLGKKLTGGKFKQMSHLNQPPEALVNALNAVEEDCEFDETEIGWILGVMLLDKHRQLAKRTSVRPAYVYDDPDDRKVDMLFPTDYLYLGGVRFVVIYSLD
jgi:hypothetical protein